MNSSPRVVLLIEAECRQQRLKLRLWSGTSEIWFMEGLVIQIYSSFTLVCLLSMSKVQGYWQTVSAVDESWWVWMDPQVNSCVSWKCTQRGAWRSFARPYANLRISVIDDYSMCCCRRTFTVTLGAHVLSVTRLNNQKVWRERELAVWQTRRWRPLCKGARDCIAFAEWRLRARPSNAFEA